MARITIHALITPEEAYAEALNRFNCLSVDASRFSNQKQEVNERPPSFRPLSVSLLAEPLRVLGCSVEVLADLGRFDPQSWALQSH
jgi:hypothetical protein